MDIGSLHPLNLLAEHERIDAAARSRIVTAPAGTVLYGIGDTCRNFLIVIDGAVAVRQTTAAGKRIVLYRLAAGEACALTTMALFTGSAARHVAEASAERDCRVLAIPAELFHELVERSPAVLAFAMAACARRFDDLLRRIDGLTQHRIDLRLAETLLARSDGVAPIRSSHEVLAAEVGTAREVVSRHLARFERLGLIERRRGSVVVLDRGALQALLRERD